METEKQIELLYRGATNKLIRILNSGTSYDRYQSSQLLKQVDSELQTLGKSIKTVMTKGITQSYSESVAGSLTSFDKQAIQVIADDSFLSFGNSMRGMYSSAQRILNIATKKRIQTIIGEGSITGSTLKEITNEIAGQLKDGFITMRDKGGKTWRADTYASMLARTKMTEASVEGFANQMVKEGRDLVQVSKHPTSCRLCASWAGRILSISGKNDKFFSLQDAKDAGLFHPNCRHVLSPYSVEQVKQTTNIGEIQRINQLSSRDFSTRLLPLIEDAMNVDDFTRARALVAQMPDSSGYKGMMNGLIDKIDTGERSTDMRMTVKSAWKGVSSDTFELTPKEVKLIKATGLEIDKVGQMLDTTLAGQYLDEQKLLQYSDLQNGEETFFHEFGHFIDYNIATERASYSDDFYRIMIDPETGTYSNEVQYVVRNRFKSGLFGSEITEAELTKALDNQEFFYTNSVGTRVKQTVDIENLGYLYSDTEVFAEAFKDYRLDPNFKTKCPQMTAIFDNLWNNYK